MTREEIIRLVQHELAKHTLDTFVENPPAIGDGGKGVVVTGCPLCRKKFGTINQLMAHLSDDVIPGVVDLILDGGREPGLEG